MGGIDRCGVVPVVDAREEIAGVDDLVVRYRHIRDIAGDFGADRNRTPIDEGVVGGFEMSRVQVIEDARDDRRDEDDDTEKKDDGMTAPDRRLLLAIVRLVHRGEELGSALQRGALSRPEPGTKASKAAQNWSRNASRSISTSCRA